MGCFDQTSNAVFTGSKFCGCLGKEMFFLWRSEVVTSPKGLRRVKSSPGVVRGRFFFDRYRFPGKIVCRFIGYAMKCSGRNSIWYEPCRLDQTFYA